MPRPFTRRRQAGNDAFLEALRRTGNARLAARELGVHRSTYLKRRARCPAFAAAWDAALAAARPHRRRPRALGITPETDAALLALLAEGCSLRLAADLSGFAHSSFLARARADPAFAHELEVHAAIGRDRLLLEAMERAADPAPTIERYERRERPLPPMTVEEALHRLHLANPNGRFQQWVRSRRPPPRPFERYAPGVRAKANALLRRRHHDETGSWRLPHEAPLPRAPDPPPARRGRGTA